MFTRDTGVTPAQYWIAPGSRKRRPARRTRSHHDHLRRRTQLTHRPRAEPPRSVRRLWCVPAFRGVGFLEFSATSRLEEGLVGRRGYPPEFRRKVLDLLEAGRPVADVAQDLDISDQTIYNWRRQDRIDRGLVPGLSTAERRAAAAKKRIASSRPSWRSAGAPSNYSKGATPKAVRGRRGDGRGGPAGTDCLRVLGVSESGFYACADGPVGAVDPARLLTDLIRQIHTDSRHLRRPTDPRRAHPGPRHQVGHNQVELLMRRAGLRGVTGRRKWKRRPDRHRHRPGRAQLRPHRPEPAVGHRHHRAPHP